MSCDKLSSAKMLLPARQPCKTHCIYVSQIAYVLSMRVPSCLLQANPGRTGIHWRPVCQCDSCTSSTSCRTGS